jgi:hypothetical protein
MKSVIKADRSMVFAAQHNAHPEMEAAHDGKQSVRQPIMEPNVNTMIDSKPRCPTVLHQRSPEHQDLSHNHKVAAKRAARQVWATGAHFPNAHAFPDNPLRSAYDYLFR